MIRIFTLILCCCLLSLSSVFTQPAEETLEISLLTCSPGSELYTKFGHSAIRLLDRQTGTDLVYNYGIFDFDTPNFYGKFTQGSLQYWLAVQPTQGFLRMYALDKRGVIEQKIYLEAEEKKKIRLFLEENRRPENRYYRYDPFLDNCATRVRDVLFDVLKDKIEVTAATDAANSFRQLMATQLVADPWPNAGGDSVETVHA